MRSQMKRKIVTGMLFVMVIGLLSGCRKKQEKAPETEAVTEAETEAVPVETEIADTHEGEAESYLTGEWILAEQANKRPIALMVENTKVTLPQYGLNRAGIIYECPVEGGITRLMALFQDYSGMDVIGNVRSCRPYYVNFAKEYDAIYMHAGASNEGTELLNASGIDHIDGITGQGGKSYYRDKSRKAPHNLYTSSDGIDSGIASYAFRREHDSSYSGHFQFAPEDAAVTLPNGVDAAVVSLYFRDPKPWFEYHADDQLYYRYEFGNPQMDAIDQSQIAVRNIILQECRSSFYDKSAGTLNLDCFSGGSGKYITNGKCIDITWKRESDSAITRYYDLSGNEITLNRGKTWIGIIQSSYADENHIYGTKEEFESSR